jgi:hypothetical protein
MRQSEMGARKDPQVPRVELLSAKAHPAVWRVASPLTSSSRPRDHQPLICRVCRSERCGFCRANWSSLSHKESRFINGLPSETLNHDAPRFGNQFMGPEPSADHQALRGVVREVILQATPDCGLV